LDQIDQRGATLNDVYNYEYTGMGVKAYVFDTGINSTHEEFGSRVTTGYSAINDDSSTEDCHGHGSHAAGVIGGAVHGVAKQVTLIPVRVLGCSASGSSTDVIEGINWMIDNHQPGDLAVANLSIGGAGTNTAFDDSVRNALNAGIHVVIAAGNRNRDACTLSPSRVTEAIIVGGLDRDLTKGSYSNFGTCLDVWAPGSDVVAAWFDLPNSYRSRSGTSMAAPFVAGVVALMLEEYGQMTPTQMSDLIVSNSTANLLTDLGTDSPNLLVHSLSESVQNSTSTTIATTTTESTTTTTVATEAIATTSSGGGGSSSGSSTTPRSSTTTSSSTTTTTSVAVAPATVVKQRSKLTKKCRPLAIAKIGKKSYRCTTKSTWVELRRK
jgi:subtilisin family serine protease